MINKLKDFFDFEFKQQGDGRATTVTSEDAAKAFNDLCKMIGGRWPDMKMEREAPIAHQFFTSLCNSEKEFKVEPKYLVMKWDDIEQYLSEADKESIYAIDAKIDKERAADGKRALKGIFINQEWDWCYDECLEVLKSYVEQK